ncbi:hypothetical protein Q5752_003499 [Cryptotrichosporon argae]
MVSTAASLTAVASASRTSGGTTTASGYSYSYGTSKIVRVAVAAGIIILVLTALVLFFKISSWIRYNQSLRRQHALTALLESEQEAKAFEIAAWADEPGHAPVGRAGGAKQAESRYWWGGRRVKKGLKGHKRGRTNAHAVHEWEGVPA